ncbi:hypothetical protein J4T76_10035 [Gilliamella sp. B3022]|uniref:hypothetical protein n=1 Tax=unclassified Gilliamella TaxID=2685620 RepID=UPI0022699AB2|nr:MULTISPECIES: hypothetical protein [unclassified Gilliamella]MCX8656545.1 hypothetical protein [Gilliamella sp. B2894]MCX8693143.1 hypothetical protein [Gilliamella sp. B2881]WDM18432.1 hypothetical protein J4T76_10035 [Gilliamella sp. B3022]
MITPEEWKKLKVGDLLYLAAPSLSSTRIKTKKISQIDDECIIIKNNDRTSWIRPLWTGNYFCKKNDAIEHLMSSVINQFKKREEKFQKTLQKLQNQLERENGN